MKTKSIFLLTFLLAACLASAQSYIPLQQHMQGVSGAEKITNLAEVEADLGRFTNLSATTGILSTANAQTLNVTGNATVNGFNYTASPTLNGASSTESTSTSVVGGIWNGDFSKGEGLSTSTSGWFNDEWVYTELLGGDGTLSITNGILKLSATTADDDSYIYAWYGAYGNWGQWINVAPSTTYRLTANYKIEDVSATGSIVPRVVISYYLSDGSTQPQYVILNAPTTVEWTSVSNTFTTSSTQSKFSFIVVLRGLGTLYIDNIKLEQVTAYTNNSTTPTVAYPVITGVSSEFVDQQNTTSSDLVTIGDSGGTEYWSAQSFIPTQIKESGLSLTRKADSGTPTGNLIIEKRTDNAGVPSSTIIASVDVEVSTLATWSVDTVKTFPIFSLNTPGTKYWYILRSDVNESTGNAYNFARSSTTDSYASGGMFNSTNSGSSWSAVSNADWTFKTHYAENTRQITLTNSSTGTSTIVDWGDDGLPDGAVVDLYNGTMSWDTSEDWSAGSGSLGAQHFFSAVLDLGGTYNYIAPYGYVDIFGTSFVCRNIAPDYDLMFGDVAGALQTYLTFKISGKYINDATVTIKSLHASFLYGLDVWKSFDNSNWIKAASSPYSSIATTDYLTFRESLNGKDLYTKLTVVDNGVSTRACLNKVTVTATLDTSAIAPLLLAAGSNTITQSVNGGSYKADVAIKSVSGGFQTTLNEANKQLTVLRNAPRSYLETPDKTTNAIVVDNDELVSISGPVQVNGATIMNASTTPAYDIVLPYNSGGAIGSSWNTYSETKYKNIISDVTEASYANIASRLAGVQSKMVTRKIPDAVKAKFFDAEIEWVTDVVSVTEELKTQVVEPVYEVVKLDSKVTLDSKATEEQLLTAEASPKIVSYATKEVSVLRSPGEYPRQEFRGWKVRAGVDEATKKQLENLYLKPHPEPIADTAPEAYRVPEGFAWSKWIEESTLYHNWILPQIINEIPQLRKRLEALEASK